MNPVNQAMCDLTADLVQALADDGIPVNSRFWGITQNGSASLPDRQCAVRAGADGTGFAAGVDGGNRSV